MATQGYTADGDEITPAPRTLTTHLLTGFEVWTHEVQERDVSLLQDKMQDREGTSQPFDLS